MKVLNKDLHYEINNQSRRIKIEKLKNCNPELECIFFKLQWILFVESPNKVNDFIIFQYSSNMGAIATKPKKMYFSVPGCNY